MIFFTAYSCGSWPVASVPHCMSLSVGLLECLHDMVADFSPPPESKRSKSVSGGVSPAVFHDLVLEVTHCHFCFILFVRSTLSPYSSRGDFGELNIIDVWSYFKSISLKISNQEENSHGDESGEIQSGVPPSRLCVVEDLGWKLPPSLRCKVLRRTY